jgi:hypothetical protein
MGFRFIWQNGQKKGCTDILQQLTNADKFDENERRKVYSFALENEKGIGEEEYTGCFIMYSGITKVYYRKTVGHVFTKLVQIERTTQKIFPQ